jgi:hypothetical protein
MAILKNASKAAYWDAHRPGKDPDSFTAYIGLAALLLAGLGLWRGKGYMKWVFAAGALVAFWSTLGPTLLGLPTPSGLIHALYASFARRILIYKVFVQFGIAGLAGMGFVELTRMLGKHRLVPLAAGVSLVLLAEYCLVPPALSVDLTENPVIYQHVRNLPEDAGIIEVPLQRNNGYTYQGYLYYQILHQKPLFNPHYGISRVPEPARPFYTRMNVPIEACEYANLGTLRYLGITHLVYHWFIGTNTVVFRALTAPALYNKNVPGLKLLYETTRNPQKVPYRGPFDYSFADLYEIIAEPCPIAITYDYPSPYEPLPGTLEQDFQIPVGDFFSLGWASALFDTTRAFYYPMPNGDLIDRIMHRNGAITLSNLSPDPIECSLSFWVSAADSGRVLEAGWEDRGPETFTIGPVEQRVTLAPIRLPGNGTGTVRLTTDRGPFNYNIGTTSLPAYAVIRDARVQIMR